MTKALAAAALTVVLTASAQAETAGIQNHEVQRLFIESPCGDVLARIDNPTPGPEGIGHMAMTFGFLMGYEVANPGIKGDSETLLTRLRADCATDGTRTGMDWLRSYHGG